MVVIPAGQFQMGNPQGDRNQRPAHWVDVKMFGLGKYEVTFAEYDKFVEAVGKRKSNDYGWGRGNLPVINIYWDDAVAYADWLSQQTGQRYRLPFEVEWEYAARAGVTASNYWDNKTDKACYHANVHDITSKTENRYSWPHYNCTDRYANTAPVGRFKPNAFGLFDMLGNVWEWTCSEYENGYSGKEKQCAQDSNRNLRVIRGGSWYNSSSFLQVSNRSPWRLSERNPKVGFRLVREYP